MNSRITQRIKGGFALLLAMTVAWLAGCDRTGQSANAGHAKSSATTPKQPYTVVATTAMIADIVSNVAGPHATVKTLMGPGTDPHLFRPTRDDVAKLLDADVVFYNGLNLEGKMSDTLVKVATSGKRVYAVTELIDEKYLLEPAEFHGHYDPHVWMDAGGWIKSTEVVVAKLADEYDTAHAAEYRANGQKYLDQLKKLDEYARKSVATIPASQRVLVTAHDAFNYFARAYGIEVQGIQGISTDSEAGLKRIEELVNMLVSRKVAAVFTESSVSDKHIKALVEGAKARGHEVRIGGELFSDAMGAPGTYEGTYLGMIDHNVTTIVRALGGTAPERGLSGQLAPTKPK
jgi:manganese/zinc/iron transport system substrate-binding protein